MFGKQFIRRRNRI